MIAFVLAALVFVEEKQKRMTYDMILNMNVQVPPFYDQCYKIMNSIMAESRAVYFFKPVEPEVDLAHDYFKYITEPMSFYDVQEKLDSKQYKTPEDFIQDVRQIWLNAKYYNLPSNQIHNAATALSKKFETLIQSLPRTISEEEKCSALQNYVELRMKRYRVNKHTHL